MFTMEGMMKKQACVSNTASSALAMHRDSQLISKVVKPKIRIIHIFAPEIIKTDVANFRELVQRLTGKPTQSSNKPRALTSNKQPLMMAKKMELPTAGGQYRSSSEFRERIKFKGEEGMSWGGGGGGHQQTSGGGFLGGFADLDNFMQEFSGFPLDASHMDAFGDSQQLA